MVKPDFISSVSVGASRVSECSLWTNPEPPAGPMATDANIELSNPAIQTDQTTGEKFAEMSLTASMACSDDDQTKTPRVRLSVRVNARVSSQGLTEHAARVAAVSHLYPQASAYLSQLGAMGQVNSLSLMAIDAEALVNALESAAQA